MAKRKRRVDVDRARKLARHGLGAEAVAERMGLEGQPEEGAARAAMDEAMRAGEDAYLAVEEALLKLACGYKTEIVKHFKEVRREFDPATGKKVAEMETAVPKVEEVYVQPSVTAAVYWLGERRPSAFETADDETRLMGAVDALLSEVKEKCEKE